MGGRTAGGAERVLAALEVPALAAVPAALLACAAAGVSASAGLTLLVVVLCLLLFLAGYEGSRPALRQVVPTSTLAALAAAGRVLFAPVPDFKPVSAIAIVAGSALGRRDGFMVGALAALVSNLFFGQGPWTPWQMYAWGLVGYLAGVLSDAGALRRPWATYAYGFASALLYGLVLNGWYVIGFVSPLTWPAVLAAFVAALPLDCVHGAATVAFLAVIWAPWHAKIERVLRKYGV
jgi:energy-coupling factor transport system substrate-specific component